MGVVWTRGLNEIVVSIKIMLEAMGTDEIKKITGWGGEQAVFHVEPPDVSCTPSYLELRLEKNSARMSGWEYTTKEIS